MLTPFSFIIVRCPIQSLERSYKFDQTIDSEFDEGIYLASPELWHEVKKEEKDKSKKDKKNRSLLKYWLRSCTRCTPFGLFAGITMATSDNTESSIILKDTKEHTRKINLEWNSLLRLITSIIQIPAIQDQIKFYKNNSIYEILNEYRYVEYSVKNNIRKYELSSIKKNEYIEAILKLACKGVTKKTMAEKLISNFDANNKEANDFIIDLIQSQLLIAELEPSITGEDQLEHLINELKKLSGIAELIQKLENISYEIKHPKHGAEFYQNLELLLREINLLPKHFKNNFYTDLHITTKESKIDSNIIETITKQAEDLMCFSQSLKNEELNKFVNQFNSKYKGEQIPLAVALDAEIGIGYAGIDNESINNIDLVSNLYVVGIEQPIFNSTNYVTDFSLHKYLDYLKSENKVIEINHEDLKPFNNKKSLPIPNSIYLFGSLLKTKNKLNIENFQFYLKGSGGPSGANLYGRFAQGDTLLYNSIKNIVDIEEKQNPEVIFAEIIHLPSVEKLGNVILRPLLRKYEIPYVTKSGVLSENQIPIDDIVVCIKNSQIILISKKFNKRIIPRLTSAHNYSLKSLPVYKFLCDLQLQSTYSPIFWDWGDLITQKKLPRVVYKNLIIKKSQWNITLLDIIDLPQNSSDYLSYFKKFCSNFDLPNNVEYVEGDNLLMIDFEQTAGIQLFLFYLRKNNSIRIQEFLFNEENCFVRDEENRPYTNEIIIPVHQNINIIEKNFYSNNTSSIKSKFTPNSEWLYFKLYGSPKLLEKILIQYILPFIEESLEAPLFEKYFFIRYKDAFHHLRLRFYNSDISKNVILQKAFLSILQPLLTNGMLQNIIIDTYDREIERYGSSLIEESESLFFSDSLCTMRFIKLLDGVDAEKYRLLFALRGIDILLNDFNLDILQKSKLLQTLSDNFFKEFGGLPILKRQLKHKYRLYKDGIFSHMNFLNDKENEIEEGIEIFKQRSNMNIIPMGKILGNFNTIKFEQNQFDFISSHIHMFVNRSFIVKQRKFELVIYDFLQNYYKSQIAIKNL